MDLSWIFKAVIRRNHQTAPWTNCLMVKGTICFPPSEGLVLQSSSEPPTVVALELCRHSVVG